MLLALVTQQVIATREAVDVGAAGDRTVEHGLRRRGLVVGPHVTVAVLGVEEALVARRALVRPLRTVEVSLLVTSASLSMRADDRCD